MLRISPFLVVVVCLTACQQDRSLTDAQKADVIEEVRVTLDNYYADIRKSGLTAEFKYLDSTDEFFWVPPGFHSAISFDSVEAILNENAGKYKLVENVFQQLEIIPLTRDHASYTGRLTSTTTDTTNNTVSVSLVETGVLIRRDGRWKLLHGQTSLANEQ